MKKPVQIQHQMLRVGGCHFQRALAKAGAVVQSTSPVTVTVATTPPPQTAT